MTVEETKDASVLFSCPNEGCIKVYERYSSLERHMSFGKCELIPEKETLLDRAKLTYHAILQDDIGIAKVFEGRKTEKKHGSRSSSPEGWALLTAKKSSRFNKSQRKYLEEKFELGQQTGHKQNPERVARDMRCGKKQMVRGCSRVMSFLPRSRYSLSFQDCRASCVTL